jgi:leader peptidase (prepilin peptidase) / N-methyltransferase
MDPYVFCGLAVVLGLFMGSFLGCAVYRIPREISLWNPSRSFCPNCRSLVRWYQNIPVVSWILLRGRCATCKAPISWRYPLVELLTALLFVVATWRFGFPVAIALWFFYAALLAATFIDLEFTIIPDVISVGMILLGLFFSALFPSLHQTESHWIGLASSAIGMLVGAAILYVVAEFGKLVFGRYKLKLREPVAFHLESADDENPCLFVGEEAFSWDTHFFRRSDRIRLNASEIKLNGESVAGSQVSLFVDHLQLGKQSVPLQDVKQLVGKTFSAEFPREAMGLGDVKLLAAIGAFTGWKGVLFCLPAAAFLGSIYGLIAMLFRRDRTSSRIPFGPFLSLGALIWTLAGPELLAVYLRWLLG